MNDTDSAIPILPANVPIPEPDLPESLVINTLEQFHALSDTTRHSIIGLLNQKPLTAKQVAAAMQISTGAANHHMQVLEAAGYIKVIARRLVKGIIAKYYSRTARTFLFDFPDSPEVTASFATEILTQAKQELAQSLSSQVEPSQINTISSGFPHARISRDRAQYYIKKINELIDEFTQETPDATGELFGFLYLFLPVKIQETIHSQKGEEHDNK